MIEIELPSMDIARLLDVFYHALWKASILPIVDGLRTHATICSISTADFCEVRDASSCWIELRASISQYLFRSAVLADGLHARLWDCDECLSLERIGCDRLGSLSSIHPPQSF
jgi:hypothetical protein